LTSEEAVLLVAAHLEKYTGSIPKADLPKKFSLLPPAKAEDRPYPAQPLPGTAGRDKGNWMFEDTNASTLLIRNAIGDGDAELRSMVLSLNGAEARDLRDDMTAT
jgi:pyruvate dehydrogenase phosphatase